MSAMHVKSIAAFHVAYEQTHTHTDIHHPQSRPISAHNLTGCAPTLESTGVHEGAFGMVSAIRQDEGPHGMERIGWYAPMCIPEAFKPRVGSHEPYRVCLSSSFLTPRLKPSLLA